MVIQKAVYLQFSNEAASKYNHKMTTTQQVKESKSEISAIQNELRGYVREDLETVIGTGRLAIAGSREGLVEVRGEGEYFQVFLSGNVQRTGKMGMERMITFLLENIYFID